MKKLLLITVVVVAAFSSKGVAMSTEENDCLKVMCEPGPRVCCTSGGITTYHDDEVVSDL